MSTVGVAPSLNVKNTQSERGSPSGGCRRTDEPGHATAAQVRVYPGIDSSFMQHPAPFDVAIVGAGISGLAVAHRLLEAHCTAAIFEASSRVGGRLRSVDGLDTGATWFWPNERRVAALTSRFGVATHSQHLAGNAVHHTLSGAQEVQGNPLDVVSSRFTNGADSLALAVANQLPEGTIHFEHNVDKVEHDAHHDVLVATARTTLVRARHIVLALPPALVTASIDFEPPLPEALRRHAERTPVWMGNMTKVVVRYNHAFWRRSGRSGSALSDVGPIREIHDMSGRDGVPAALFGFVPPAHAGAPTVTDGQVVDQLVEIFGPEAATPVAVTICDWRNEPLTSPPSAERLTAYDTYGHDVFRHPTFGGRLHWTSTETSATHPGHIEGALEAAERTSTAVLDHLSRNESEHLR